MLNPEQNGALERAIDERIVRLERRIEKIQVEIGNLETAKDMLGAFRIEIIGGGGGGGGGPTLLPTPPPPQS